jgi:hypothetical protein
MVINHHLETISTSPYFFTRPIFRPVDPFGLYICMLDLYNETVTRNGKIYHYDPDHDVYHSRSHPESALSQSAWIIVCIVLAIVCYGLEHAS